ncbi:MAG: orotidine-5'-phosphate decarboxylase [Bacilli bacterium]|jgi:orotidine-5'-phosphate decarboxylase|nr:orotidine-5'-phosphate decarboxylase [Bacilli bacterium]
MVSKVIIALDFKNKEETMRFLKYFKEPIFVKVGMELFYSEGKNIIEEIKALNHHIFLDLKLHDIPNTVASALQVLKPLAIDIINVHCAGGYQMMKAAQEVFKDTDTKVIGVSQLTSTSSTMLHDELLIKESMIDTIISYALNAQRAGLAGIVCSPLEAQQVHLACGLDFLCICPGIRYQSNGDDQVRVTTPSMAAQLTCDYIVVGRPITKATDRVGMYQKIKEEFEG